MYVPFLKRNLPLLPGELGVFTAFYKVFVDKAWNEPILFFFWGSSSFFFLESYREWIYSKIYSSKVFNHNKRSWIGRIKVGNFESFDLYIVPSLVRCRRTSIQTISWCRRASGVRLWGNSFEHGLKVVIFSSRV